MQNPFNALRSRQRRQDFAADARSAKPVGLGGHLRHQDDVNWDEHDLDDDGVVDDSCASHQPCQESGAGGPDRIWSHFTHLMEPVSVASGVEVAHYAMATSSGTGAKGPSCTRCPPLGAIDLYPFMTGLGRYVARCRRLTSWRQEMERCRRLACLANGRLQGTRASTPA